MSTREHGTITHSQFGKCTDHDVWIAELRFDFGGSLQSMQLCTGDGKTTRIFEKMIRDLFGGDPLGRQAWALRAFPYWNDPIVGVEVDGRRVTRNDLLRAIGKEPVCQLADRQASIKASIVRHAEEIRCDMGRLDKLAADYAEWDKP